MKWVEASACFWGLQVLVPFIFLRSGNYNWVLKILPSHGFMYICYNKGLSGADGTYHRILRSIRCTAFGKLGIIRLSTLTVWTTSFYICNTRHPSYLICDGDLAGKIRNAIGSMSNSQGGSSAALTIARAQRQFQGFKLWLGCRIALFDPIVSFCLVELISW